jgi:hypothetical protein
MMKTYRCRNIFKVVSIEADRAFESIRHVLQDEPYQIALTICDADRHAEKGERQIRFLKERIRSVRLMMPYEKIPKQFTIEMVHTIIKLINSLPKQNGIHSIITTRNRRVPSDCDFFECVTEVRVSPKLFKILLSVSKQVKGIDLSNARSA